ncbi:MAG: hypothetical protein ACFKPT_00910 [Gloeotrichia echinulata GP01]
MIQPQPDIDNTNAFNQLQSITNELHQKLAARFELHPDPSVQDVQKYNSLDGNLQGSLTAFTGKEIDWLVHSWLGNPEK